VFELDTVVGLVESTQPQVWDDVSTAVRRVETLARSSLG